MSLARRRYRSFEKGLVAATMAALGVACGAPASNAANYSQMRNPDAANVAQQAAEPREGDPTAGAGPAPLPPTAPKKPAPAPASGPRAEPTTTTTTTSSTSPPTRIGARHVLIQYMGAEKAAPSVVRSRDQALSVAQEVLRRARAKEDFARLAIEFSDEPGAGGRGGSLGRFTHGQMVPAFEAAAFKLEVGQISDIVETPFGFHIIQRTE